MQRDGAVARCLGNLGEKDYPLLPAMLRILQGKHKTFLFDFSIFFFFLDEPVQVIIHTGWLLLIILTRKNDIKDLY